MKCILKTFCKIVYVLCCVVLGNGLWLKPCHPNSVRKTEIGNSSSGRFKRERRWNVTGSENPFVLLRNCDVIFQRSYNFRIVNLRMAEVTSRDPNDDVITIARHCFFFTQRQSRNRPVACNYQTTRAIAGQS